jgi:hypothetical protein
MLAMGAMIVGGVLERFLRYASWFLGRELRLVALVVASPRMINGRNTAAVSRSNCRRNRAIAKSAMLHWH